MNLAEEQPRCSVDLEETADGGVAVTLAASRFHLQWHSLPDGVLPIMEELLAKPCEDHKEVVLGNAFGGAEVLLVVFETVVRLKVLKSADDLEFSDLFEVTLSPAECRVLREAIQEAREFFD